MLIVPYSEWSILMSKIKLFLKKIIQKVSKLWDMESKPLKNIVSW